MKLRVRGCRSWLSLCEVMSQVTASGHLTLFKFGGGWKAMLGTSNEDDDRGVLWALRAADSVEDACRDLAYRERWVTFLQAVALEDQWAAAREVH